MIIDCVARGRRQEEGVKWAEILFGWFVFRFFVTARGLGVARRGAALLAPVKKKRGVFSVHLLDFLEFKVLRIR